MSHDTAIALIRRLVQQGVNVTEVSMQCCVVYDMNSALAGDAWGNVFFLQAYLDTVGDPSSYAAKLTSLFPTMKVTVESKADSTYPIVSAASICAKVGND